MSPDVKNEVLESAASLLLHEIKAEVHETPGTYYSLMAAEYKDESKCEYIAVCVRYVPAGTDTDAGELSRSTSERILPVIEPLHLISACWLCVLASVSDSDFATHGSVQHCQFLCISVI